MDKDLFQSLKQKILQRKEHLTCKSGSYLADIIYDFTKLTQIDSQAFSYYGSLTPTIEILKKNNSIRLYISSKNDLNNLRLNHHNNVNRHHYKPSFYQSTNNELICHAASTDIAIHTMRGLARVISMLKENLNPKIHIEIDNKNDTNCFNQDIIINQKVIICRIESAIRFYSLYLAEKFKIIDKKEVIKLKINTEIKRLYNSPQIELFELIHKLKLKGLLEIDNEKHHGFIRIQNIKIFNNKITLIQLPWGIELSMELANYLYKSKPQNVGIVGGVGLIKANNLNIDDLVIPKSLALKDLDTKIYLSLNNNILNNNDLYKTDNITTFPKLSMSSSLPATDEFDTVEMENFILALGAQRSNSSICIGNYIMDKPKEGYGLGKTYYSRKFLLDLFNKEHRGKDKALYYVSKQLNIF